MMLIEPERFPQQPFVTITLYGTAHFFAGNDREPGTSRGSISFRFIGFHAPVSDKMTSYETLPVLLDIRKIRLDHLRKNIGIVLQEPYLFSRTLKENLGITRSAMAEEEMREAARAACLEETIQGFAKGYDTFVGERGVTLSGGQKQRAAIARMLTQNAPVMVFDDSLSAVDTETDARIRRELEKRFGSATIILISHRITTLSKADQVLVLDRGRVAQLGTPEELRQQPGLYRQIYEIQTLSREEATA